MRSGRCSFPEVYGLIVAILIADENETTAPDAGVVAAHYTDTEDGPNECIYCIALG